jgi:hypothetical protein
MKPTQPLTSGIFIDWNNDLSKIMTQNSDIITFHNYNPKPVFEQNLNKAKELKRPVICTEWLHRPRKNLVADILPLLKETNTGSYHWGLVNGKTQTHLQWGSRPQKPLKGIWQCDLMHNNGTAYNPSELLVFRKLAGNFSTKYDSIILPNVEQNLKEGQWNIDKINNWYAQQKWIVGCNFLPSTAVNDVEMWQDQSFDLKTIDKELELAKAWGINSVRVFLNYVVWEAEAEKFKSNFTKFLDAAEKHGISVMPILFDDCNFSGNVAKVGKQPEPVSGVHNSGWVSSPPASMVRDESQWQKLKAYEQDFIKTFANDKRIIIWDLYNEPGNSGSKLKSNLLENIFAWAREIKPTQPLTIGAYHDFNGELSKLIRDYSDVVSFHIYENKSSVENKIQWAHASGRPAVCTEWLKRQDGNTPQNILPLFKSNLIGGYNWGLVAGRTQTYLHWGSRKGSPTPSIWQHDLIREDGTPYDIRELALFRNLSLNENINQTLKQLGILKELIATSDSTPIKWLYTEKEPPTNWTTLDFNDSTWQTGIAPFGTEELSINRRPKTKWNSNSIWLRHSFELDESTIKSIKHLEILIHFDENATIYLNGTEIKNLSGYNAEYQSIRLDDNSIKLLQNGKNLLAIKCSQTTGGQFIDAGLYAFANAKTTTDSTTDSTSKLSSTQTNTKSEDDKKSDESISKRVESIVGKHVIRFTKPAERIPSQFSVFAPLLGNGFSGVALSGKPEHQVFYAARNDFWRLKHGHSEAYPAVLGKIELNIPQLEGASFLIEQNLYDATTKAQFKKNNFTVEYKTFLAATDDILVVEINMIGDETLNGNIHISLPDQKELQTKPPVYTTTIGKTEINTTPEGIQYLSRAFEESVDIPTKAALALRINGDGVADGNFTLKQNQPVRFVCTFSSNFKNKNCTAEVIRKAKEFSPSQQQELEKNHKQWWKNYWEKSFVSIPDDVIEKQYYVSLYGIASASRDAEFPPPIFGTWITAEQPAWGGDYHLNYNHMAPFYALYSANRIEQAEPYYRPLLAIIPRGHYYSKKLHNIDDGILLPVGIGPLGIESTRWTPTMEKHRAGWKDKGVEDEGMFWGQKSNASYAVVNLSMQFYHTWDKEFCQKVYPFVKATANFWEKYLVYENGRYVDNNDAIHEATKNDVNPILALGLIKLTMQTVTDMSILLDVDSDKREKWMHIHDHISEFPTQEIKGKTVFRLTEKGMNWAGGNTLGIQHIYPAGQIGLDSDPKLREIAKNTIDAKQRWLDSNGSNSFFPAAVRIGYDPKIIMQQLRRYSTNTCPNGFQLNNPHGIENFSTVPNTINEMLCMGHKNVVRIFPVWDRTQDASFYQIRVEGAFIVSSTLKDGEVTELSIYSEKGRPLCLLNPWKNKPVNVSEWIDNKQVNNKEYSDKYINLKTKPNTKYTFSVVK